MQTRLIFDLPDPEATDRLARRIAPLLGPGDTMLLEGPIGSGKSHLARALIRARLGNPAEDVPSPSFTLVQTYAADPPVWHADLYRLTHPDEVMELGLDEAFPTAICLVEWPDRLGAETPKNAITVTLSLSGAGRRAVIAFQGRAGLASMLRQAAALDFAQRSGWGGAVHHPLAGDASGRRFERLQKRDGTAVLLDNPPGLPDRLDDFLRMDRHLRGIGLSAPKILAEDLGNGFLLMEDLGDDLFSRRIAAAPETEAALYRLATDVLVALQSHPAPTGLADLTADDWAGAAMLALSHYRRGATGEAADPGALQAALAAGIRQHADGARVLIHRDYFAGNLMLLPGRAGIAQVGLIDFQLGQMGQPVYDLVSLLQDARRDVSPAVEAEMKLRFARARGLGDIEAAYAIWGAQRALRILGIFARLCLVEGKDGYLVHLPRVMRDLWRNLRHPALGEVKRLCDGLLPDPTPEVLARLGAQCGHFR